MFDYVVEPIYKKDTTGICRETVQADASYRHGLLLKARIFFDLNFPYLRMVWLWHY